MEKSITAGSIEDFIVLSSLLLYPSFVSLLPRDEGLMAAGSMPPFVQSLPLLAGSVYVHCNKTQPSEIRFAQLLPVQILKQRP